MLSFHPGPSPGHAPSDWHPGPPLGDDAGVKTRVVLASVAMSLVVLSSVGTSLASPVVTPDPDDSPGKLDVSSVTQYRAGTEAGARLRIIHSLTTYEPWDSNLLHFNYIYFHFCTDGDGDGEKQAIVTWRGGQKALDAWVSEPGTDREHSRTVKVFRPDDASLAIKIPLKALGKRVHLHNYGWDVLTQFHEEGHPVCGTTDDMYWICGDRVPDDSGYITYPGVVSG